VGTAGFGEEQERARAFDQQPVEAIATRVFGWFLGSNDLSVRWSIRTPAVAAMDCTPIVLMRIAGVSRCCLIFSALPRFGSLRASTPA
jgi:hypothetical protein